MLSRRFPHSCPNQALPSLSLQVVLRDMAHAHSLFLNQTEWLHSRPWLQRTGGKEMAAMAPLWGALVEHAHSEFPEMWTAER